MEENKKMTNCECEGQKNELPKMPDIKILGIPDDDITDEADDVIVIPVAEYRHLVRCEAAVDLMGRLLTMHGKYDSLRAEIMDVACMLCKEDSGVDADAE